MKKLILSLMLAFVGMIGANAQVVDNGRGVDNWYVTGGVGTNVWNNSTSWLHAHNGLNAGKNTWEVAPLYVDLSVGKYFTPYIGAELNGTAMFNALGAEPNFVDAHHVAGNLVFNLSNIVAGYNGKRHPLEIEALVGMGWYHVYRTQTPELRATYLEKGKAGDASFNDNTIRGAVRVNYNVSKNWAIYVMPEYLSTMEISTRNTDMCGHGVNVYAGVKYRIPSKRGDFPYVSLYDQAEVDRLNAEINDLRADLAKKPREVVIDRTELIGNAYTVFFDKGSYSVDDITAIANALKKSDKPITIVSSTSPEGSESLNAELGINRAEAVKNALVKAGINANRIIIDNTYDKKRNVSIILK